MIDLHEVQIRGSGTRPDGFPKIPIPPVDYSALEHANLTRDYLNNPDPFLRHS